MRLLLAIPAALLLVSPAAAQVAIEPVRLTDNAVEDRTTTGSIAHTCEGESFAVWMQDQAAAGWRLMWSHADGNEWSPPEALQSGDHADFAPRVGGYLYDAHVVFQRGAGNAAEIMYARHDFANDDWVVEPITSNATEDFTPDIWYDGVVHVVWVGFDTQSVSGKIFHATRTGDATTGTWDIERLDGSQLGGFWAGAGPKVFERAGVVHVTYRGGDFGSYGAHYARHENGVWSYTTLTSPNAEDLVTDVTVGFGTVIVAMSGSDCFGCPTRIYSRMSVDDGNTFGVASLVSGVLSAELASVSAGTFGVTATAAQLSGNIYTGDLWAFRDPDYAGGWELHSLPPQSQSSSTPSGEDVQCIVAGGGLTGSGVVFTDRLGNAAADNEIFVLVTPQSGAVDDVPVSPSAGRLELSATPNPFATETAISILAPAGARAHAVVYDVHGRQVRTLLESGALAGGRAQVVWDGRNDAGDRVATGTYWLSARTGTDRAVERLVFVR